MAEKTYVVIRGGLLGLAQSPERQLPYLHSFEGEKLHLSRVRVSEIFHDIKSAFNLYGTYGTNHVEPNRGMYFSEI